MKRLPVAAFVLAILAVPGVALAQTEDHSHHGGRRPQASGP